MQSLFKVGVFLDGYAPRTEKRHGDDTKVVVLNLRIQPFDATLAVAIDDGLGSHSMVRPSLFDLSTAEPKANLGRVALALECPPQTLRVFAAPDAEVARLALPQTKISGVYARKQKDIEGWALCFKATYGECGRDELEAFHHWYRSQQFVIFEEAEPSLDTADDVTAAAPTLGAPTWDDGEAPTLDSPTAREAGTRPTARRGRQRTGRYDPQAEAAAQAEAGAEMGADDTDLSVLDETVQ